jgi:hypothetical protein
VDISNSAAIPRYEGEWIRIFKVKDSVSCRCPELLEDARRVIITQLEDLLFSFFFFFFRAFSSFSLFHFFVPVGSVLIFTIEGEVEMFSGYGRGCGAANHFVSP